MLEALDADAVRSWSGAALERLTAGRGEIDALNVFPVPDADTGSNLVHTLAAADAELRRVGATDAATALAAMARGAADAAVGNSGFIASQVLRGFADAAGAAEGPCGPATVRVALDRGAVLARTAVVEPVDGTMLTVARAAAAGAVGDTLVEVVRAATLAADVALQRTPDQLAELAAHGVVDAGGRGLVLLLAALARVVGGTELELQPVRREPDGGRPIATDHTAREIGSAAFAFEVQYRLAADETAVETLRTRLAELGDSVAVVPLEHGEWKVHAHVNDVGAAFEAGVEAGRPHRVEVVRFADQVSSVEPHPGGTAVVAVAPGAGLAHLFETEGVHVVEGGPGVEPSAQDVLDAVRSSGAREVVLLPNASQVTGVAEAAAREARAAGLRVSVVPTRSPVQGLAAIAVHDGARAFDDDVVAMAEAAAATRFAEITVATEEGLTAVGMCRPGDVLGLIDGEVVEIGRGLLAVAFGLVDRLIGVGAELMTVVIGGDAPRRAGELIEAHVRGRSPFTDVTVYHGGQPGQPVIIGVE